MRRRPTRSIRRPAGRRGRRLGLTRRAIVAAALAEIDRNGLEDFSLRRLAETLGVYPTAVTYHVGGRSQLLADVAALALADILPPMALDSWQGYLRELFARYREAIRRHPNIAPLIGTQLVANRGVDLAFVETLLATLVHAGFAGAKLVGAYNAVIAALVGFTAQEFASLPTEDPRGWQREVRERLFNVQAREYPILARNLELLANRAFILRWQNASEVSLEDSFGSFADILIAGLDHLATRS